MNIAEKEELLAPCGVKCWECRACPEECAGCRRVKGMVDWAHYIGSEICPIYACSMYERKLENCGRCPEMPCDLHTETRDPDTPLDVHLEDIQGRMHTLREYNATGIC